MRPKVDESAQISTPHWTWIFRIVVKHHSHEIGFLHSSTKLESGHSRATGTRRDSPTSASPGCSALPCWIARPSDRRENAIRYLPCERVVTFNIAEISVP